MFLYYFCFLSIVLLLPVSLLGTLWPRTLTYTYLFPSSAFFFLAKCMFINDARAPAVHFLVLISKGCGFYFVIGCFLLLAGSSLLFDS